MWHVQSTGVSGVGIEVDMNIFTADVEVFK